MLTVDDYGAIRRARRDGKSIRRIAREFGLSRITVRKALKQPEPVAKVRDRPAPKLGPFQAAIDQILADDESAPPKQRHTAAQVYRRLRDEHGYPGGYAQVQRYVRRHRRKSEETFIPLGHRPGQRLEADFGHIHVDFPDGRRLVPFLVATWAYSNAPFVLALPFERTEAILHGLVAAFEFFGAVAKEVWWDNPKTVATTILQGASAGSIRGTRRWPATTSSSRASACPAAATRSPTPRAPSRPCSAASPPPCPASPTSMS